MKEYVPEKTDLRMVCNLYQSEHGKEDLQYSIGSENRLLLTAHQNIKTVE